MADVETVAEEIQTRFADEMRRLAAPRRIALAISGGRDSIALLALTTNWARRNSATVKALTVDHGLRSGAAGEAKAVGAICERIGVRHSTLLWRGEKPKSGVQAAARAARYFLLAEYCRQNDIEALLTAHTADDLAETFMMRLARGGGLRSLAAMADDSLIAAGAHGPVRLVRPMLLFTRNETTEIAAQAGLRFIDDPSNADPVFERVRWRALLQTLHQDNFIDPSNIAGSSRRLRNSFAAAADAENAEFNRLGGYFTAWGGVSLDQAPRNAGLIARIIFAVSGAEMPISSDAAAAAVEDAQHSGASTLGGAIIQQSCGKWLFFREPAGVLGRVGTAPKEPVALDEAVVWDRRFLISSGISDCCVAPLGARPEAREMIENAPFPMPAGAADTLPAVVCRGRLIAAPPLLFNQSVTITPLLRERFFTQTIRFLSEP